MKKIKLWVLTDGFRIYLMGHSRSIVRNQYKMLTTTTKGLKIIKLEGMYE